MKAAHPLSPPSVPAHRGPDTSTTHSKNFPSLRDDSTIDERLWGKDMFSPVWKSFVPHCLLLSDCNSLVGSASAENRHSDLTNTSPLTLHVSEQWGPAVSESTASLRCSLFKKISPEDWKLSSFVRLQICTHMACYIICHPLRSHGSQTFFSLL